MSQDQQESESINEKNRYKPCQDQDSSQLTFTEVETVPNSSVAFTNQPTHQQSSDYANNEVQIELNRQPPPSRVGTRAAHKNTQSKGLTPAQQEIKNGQSPYQQSSKIHEQNRQDQLHQQQQMQSMKNWPFYQNQKDARRGGTAPEGANRPQISSNNNPYGMISGKEQAMMASGAQQLKVPNVQDPREQIGTVPQSSSSNRSRASGGGVSSQNGSQPAVTQSNQMIAKIYGKSNKFVVNHHHPTSSNNNHVNDQYKKPKIQHMKDIIRQKTSQQKTDKVEYQTTSSKPSTAQQNQNNRNLRKIKIDNSKFKNIQMNQRKNQGSQLERESQEIVARSTNNRANANRSQDFVEDNSSMIYHSKPQYNKPQASSNAQSRLDVVAQSIPSQIDRNVHYSNNDIPTDSMEQIFQPKQLRNESRSRQSQRNDGYQNQSADSVSRQMLQNLQGGETPMQGSQGQGQGQGQGCQIGNQLRDEMKNLKKQQHKGRNQPVRGIHNVGPNNNGTAEVEYAQSFEIESSQNINNTDKQRHSPVDLNINDTPVEMGREAYVSYAASNNVQFGAGKNHKNLSINGDLNELQDRGTTPHSHKRSRQLQINNIIDPDFEQSTYPNEGQPQLTFKYNRPSNLIPEKYSEMKRLQTSQGPRIQKYKQSQQSSTSAKGAISQVIPVQNIPQERPQERSQHERPERTERPQERQQPDRPHQSAPSSQMQRMQMNQKNNFETNNNNASAPAVKKIAKIKGKLSSQFQVNSMAGTGADGFEMVASTIQNNQSMPDNGFENVVDQIQMMGQGNTHVTHQFSRTIDTTPNTQSVPRSKGYNGGHNTHGPTPQASTSMKQGVLQTSSNSQPHSPATNSNQMVSNDQKLRGNDAGQDRIISQPQQMPLSNKINHNNTDGENSTSSAINQGQVPSGPVTMMPHQTATLGYQFEQWQRPPSRQKEPNQALGLDDDFSGPNRPKTRGGGGNSLGGPPANISTHHHQQFLQGGHLNHTSHMSGRERKRNIQKFIPTSQTGDAIGAQASGARPRMIDFFHQRNININGFNSTGDQTQYFQNQFHQQDKAPVNQASLGQQATFDERSDFSPLQGHQAQTQVISGTNSAQTNPRRGGAIPQGHPGHGSSQQRPPSRQKEPNQALGLDEYPPGMGFASPDEFDQPLFGGGHTPAGHGSLKGPSMGGGIIGLDVESDFENGYDAVGQESDLGLENLEAIDIENAGYFWGHGRGGAAVLHKQFKEDDDDFFDSQFNQQQRFSEGIDKFDKNDKAERRHNQTQKGAKFARQPSESGPNSSNQITYHPRGGPGHGSHQSVSGGPTFQPNSQHLLGQPVAHPQQQFAQTYGHGMSMGPMVPGTAPGAEQQNQQFQYHPALQQTQNFYIGMNQIIPQGINQDASALANDFFNMSANVSNMVNGGNQHQPPKTAGQMKRGQGSSVNQAFHSTGFVQNEGQQTTNHLHNHSNHINQDMLSRGFLNQRSPVNERSGAIQQLVLQNPHLKSMNKPKSATGNRISGNKNRFKNLNNSGRFVGQNSTIIHSAYNNNQNRQHLKIYSKPKAGGWIGDTSQTNSGSKNIGQNTSGQNSGAQTSKSKQQQKIKPGTSAGTINGGRGQLFLSGDSTQQQEKINNINNSNNNNDNDQNNNSQAPANDNIKEIIKIGQEINFNRPKESKGQRSTEKRHINNQSLGITSSGGPSLAQSGANNNTNGQGNRNPKSGNFVSSPLSGGININSNQNFKNAHNSSKNASGKEMFSQTSKFQSGPSGGLQQSSMGVVTDKLTDLTDLIPNASGSYPQNAASGLTGFQSTNQNSFKSQTLQFPNSMNSQLGDDFINLFAN